MTFTDHIATTNKKHSLNRSYRTPLVEYVGSTQGQTVGGTQGAKRAVPIFDPARKKPPQAVVKEWSPQKIVLVLQYLTITIELILPLVMFDNLFLLVLQLF